MKQGDNCWICEGWYQHEFEWIGLSGDLKGSDQLFIHLEIDHYHPCKMQDIRQDHFLIKRMVPPRSKIKYYFTTDSVSSIYVAND